MDSDIENRLIALEQFVVTAIGRIEAHLPGVADSLARMTENQCGTMAAAGHPGLAKELQTLLDLFRDVCNLPVNDV